MRYVLSRSDQSAISGQLARNPHSQLANGMIDLRRTAESLNVIHQHLGRARVREQQGTQKVPPTAEFEGPPG